MKEKFITGKRKYAGSIIMAIMLAISMSCTAFATEVRTNALHNVATEHPDEVVDGEICTYGLGKPSTAECVNLKNESLTFGGNAQRSTLYTNKHFKGKSSIGYSIRNDCDTKLTVKFYTSSGWFKSKQITIEANATLTGTIDGLDADKMYYLSFSAPSDFSGSVY